VTTIPRSRQASVFRLDLVLVFSAMLAASIGVVMVYTATRGNLLAQGFDPHYFLKRQALFVLLGLFAMAVLTLFDYRRFEQLGTAIYILLVLSLVGVLAVGSSAHGSARWFNVGPLQIEPSEFAVLGLVVAVGTYCARREEGLTWTDVIKVLALGAVPILLVMKQPDLGTAIIMLIVLLVMLAVAGLPARILLLLVVGIFVAGVLALKVGLLHQYQLARLTSFLHPNSRQASIQPAIYNVQQSKIAIGSGGLWGKGLLHGTQTNLGYVPFEQTDFIFSAVGEQLGFVGSTLVLSVLGIVGWRILRAAQLSRDTFGRLLCAGIFTFFAYSVFQNVGMNTGIMPVTGIPLPFISYGGSASLVFFAGVGIALSVYARRAG